MKAGTRAYIAEEGGKILSGLVRMAMSRPRKTIAASESEIEPPVSTEPTPTIQEATAAPAEKQDIATACIPCSLGHFSVSAGLLNEIVRFKDEGMASNEILDRIAKVLEEQNALERVDLTPEKIQSSPTWERELAEEALRQSRALRHRLEGISSIDELEQAAADTAGYYRKLNREWYKRRFRQLGSTKAEAIAQRVVEEE